MAQLKDTLVSGSLRATDTVYTTKLQTGILYAPTSSSGTTYGPGSADNILLSNGSSIYWGTIGDIEVIKLKGINNSGVAAVGTANRPTTANLNYHDGSVRYFLATSAMESSSKPTMGDGHILHLAWDNTAYAAQLAVNHAPSVHAQIRGQGSTQGNWSDWIYLLDSDNYTDYTVTKNGTGAIGTWGINVSGTAAKLSSLSSSDNASSTSTWRSVWMSYADGTTGRPALSSVLQYQTSSNTLKSSHFLAEHISKGGGEFQVKYGSTVDMALMIESGNQNHGLYDYIADKWMIFADENHNVTVNGNATSANKANITTTENAIAYYSDNTGTFASKASANGALYATSNNGALTWGTLPVAQGGTGKSSFTANSLIMSGTTTTAALTTRAISTSITTDDSTKIPTEGAVKTYVDNQIATLQDTVQDGYVTIAGNAQQVTGRKTFSNLAGASFKPAEGSESCNISYNQSLGALMFSFAK